MVEQQLKIELKNEAGRYFGSLILKANAYINELDSFEMDGIRFVNIPRVDNLINDIPIVFLDDIVDKNFSSIMLLEETKYDVLIEIKSNDESDKINIFPSLLKDNFLKHNVYDPIKFNLSGENVCRFIGVLNFHSYVGKSFLDVEVNGIRSKAVNIEVRSKKIKYFEQYPQMIGDLSEVASGLVYEIDSPLFQDLEFNPSKRKTLYEDFMFIEYLFRPENFPSSYDYILRNLYSLLVDYVEDIPTTFASNVGPSEMVDIITRPEHIYENQYTPQDWPEAMGGYVPDVVSQRVYEENIDTPENRLLKYFLESLDKLIKQLLDSIDDGYMKDQLLFYQKQVLDYLSDRWTSEVGRLDYIPLNSQVLQKKEGYRDFFKYFLNFELAFRLEWSEVEDKIRGYERKLSELYEYWCYFKMVKVLDKLSINEIKYTDLYEIDKSKWSIKVRKGIKSIQSFNLMIDNNEIYIELMYNRLFSNNTIYKSYSLPFRPDYTLMIKIGLNTYFVHFDAKYRSEGQILTFYDSIRNMNQDINKLNIEEEVNVRDLEEETNRRYKFGDIYKMHTYKDAILKTEGAYILYPGDDQKIFKVFENEPIPSVGAFPLTPGKNGIEEEELSLFIKAVIKNILYTNI